jgi:hypothetical protein
MLYVITAHTIEKTSGGAIHRKCPTFLLDSDDQGIRNADDAELVARRVINPTGNPGLAVHAVATILPEVAALMHDESCRPLRG